MRSRKDIEEALNVPFVGEVPISRKLSRRKSKGLSLMERSLAYNGSNNKHIFTEAVRTLCSNIDFMRPQSCRSYVIATTSATVASGKTFLALNIAACLADAGKRVLLIDLDLRKRNLSKVFDLRHHTVGMSNFLSDETIPVEDIIRKGLLGEADFIPAGHIPPNPVALLQRERFDKALEKFRQEYDYIILDGVPYNIVADSVVITAWWT